MAKKERIIPNGTQVSVIDDEIQTGDWGIVKMFDDDVYHVGMFGGDDVHIFDRDQLKIIGTTKYNGILQYQADDVRADFIKKALPEGKTQFTSSRAEYGPVDVIVATGRANCKCCGRKIKKGETALAWAEDMGGSGSFTATRIQIHAQPCKQIEKVKGFYPVFENPHQPRSWYFTYKEFHRTRESMHFPHPHLAEDHRQEKIRTHHTGVSEIMESDEEPDMSVPERYQNPKNIADEVYATLSAIQTLESQRKLQERNALAAALFSQKGLRDFTTEHGRVETWYDKQSRNWVTIRYDTEDNQVESEYSGDKLGAAIAHAWALTKLRDKRW